jgi:hypothetical protein
LPAALLAHTFVFGSSHTIGGSLHSLVIQAGAGFAATVAAVLGASAVRGTRRAPVSGSVLLLAALAWFAAFEFSESAHAVPVLLCTLAIALAGAICGLAVSAYTQAVRAVVEALCVRTRIAAPCLRVATRAERLLVRRFIGVFSLFSRPPPALS